MPHSRVLIHPPRRHADRVRCEGELRLAGGGLHRIYFEFSAPDDRLEAPRARPFLLAFLLPAMHAGAPLELDLPVDPVTRDNLMEWQEAMASWHPAVLQVVPILAPIETEPARHSPGALTLFSGGVDSAFTVWRHVRQSEPAPYRTTRLKAGLMVHGFDIPLEQKEVFEPAWEHTRALLTAAGLPAFRLATNVRSLDKIPGCAWAECAHGIWLAAALACFEPWFGHMLIPSSFAYPTLLLPWGSTPVTDPLFSSATTPFWHDGAGHSKLTKVRAIAREPAVQQHLRVCWEGAQLDRNCGKCFKCLATQICFLLAGVERVEAFPEACTLAQVARLPVKHAANDWMVGTMSAEARRQGREALARALDRARARARAKIRRKKLQQTMKQFFRPWR
jgi:hypothetical protein